MMIQRKLMVGLDLRSCLTYYPMLRECLDAWELNNKLLSLYGEIELREKANAVYHQIVWVLLLYGKKSHDFCVTTHTLCIQL